MGARKRPQALAGHQAAGVSLPPPPSHADTHRHSLMPRAPKAPGHHVKQPWGSSGRRRRLPPDWPAIQHAVLERDEHRCQLQYDGCTGLASHADHITPGDDHRMANLQAACSHCHAIKSSREGNTARWGDRR